MADDAVTVWVKSLEDGDQAAASQLWEYCFPRLLRYSASKMPAHLRRALDEEDIALSAFKSFCLGAAKGSFEDIGGRDELWRLLLCITARKAQNHIRFEMRKKRGGGQVSGESIFNQGDNPVDFAGINQVADQLATPELLAQFSDECQVLMDALKDENLQAIALLRLEGYSVAEISERIGCAKRTVERRLNLIRKTWAEQENKSNESDSN